MYYDGSTGDFHTFSLPPRRVACGTCGDIGASQTPPILSPSLPGLPDIPEANRTSTSQYYELLRAGVTHVLLDVRSQLQFNMISLHIEKYSTDPTCCRYLNIPYASLNASQSKDTVLLASQAGLSLKFFPT